MEMLPPNHLLPFFPFGIRPDGNVTPVQVICFTSRGKQGTLLRVSADGLTFTLRSKRVLESDNAIRT